MSIKIELVEINGEQRVPPHCMRLLLDFSGHRDLCNQCFAAYNEKTSNYCITGAMILQELGRQPEVSEA